MMEMEPFNPWIFKFLAIFGFFPISIQKSVKRFQFCAIGAAVTLLYVVLFDYKFFIYIMVEMPLYVKITIIECKLLFTKKT